MEDKKTLIVIIILLIIFLPLAIIGTIMKAKNINPLYDDNKDKKFIYNNTIYFYEELKLVAKYPCTGICSEATTIIDDDQYGLHYYQSNEKSKLQIINNQYGIFKEDDNIILYNYQLNNKMATFEAIKDYNTLTNNNILIVKHNGFFGVLKLNPIQPIINYKYDFIGLPNRMVNNSFDIAKFIVKTQNKWLIIDDKENVLFENNSPIIDFNNQYIITKEDNNITIYDYQKNVYLNDKPKDDVYCVGKYLLLITDNNLTIFENMIKGTIKQVSLPNYSNINFKINNNILEIIIDNKIFENVKLI